MKRLFTRSFHCSAKQCACFPNLFFLTHQQGGQPYNYTHLLDVVARHIRYVIDAWVEEVLVSAEGITAMQANCTPGYYNGEGKPDLSQLGMAPQKYFSIIDAWRERGDLDGMVLADASGRRVRT